MENLLISGAALEKFVALVAAQGGNPAVAQDTSLLPQAAGQEVVQALPEQEGYVAAIDAERLGVAAMTLGAGRAEKDDPIDLAVGMKLHVRQGDRVTAGQPLATLYYNKREKLEQALKLVRPAFRFSQTPVAPEPLVYALVTKKGVTALNGHSL